MAGQLETIYQKMVEQNHITFDPVQSSVLRKLQRLSDKISDLSSLGNPTFVQKLFSSSPEQPKGLYIYGDVGRGKSMLMDLFYDHCPVADKRRVHFHAFMIEVHNFMHQWRSANNGDPIAPLAQKIHDSASILCFDEFHVTDIADAMILDRLFSALYKSGLILVATSNRHPDSLYENGLQRQRFIPFIDLMKEKNHVVELAADRDYRLVHMRSMSTMYFTPLGKKATAYLNQSFDELTQYAPRIPGILKVNGREIYLPTVHGDIGMATFSDLCEKPLGAADYLELACDFSTLLLHDIPRLNAEKRNEAKRFVTLIDALYEHNVKLICTAEVSPGKLYTEGKGAFEFERTVSRLIEMQTERYWQIAHESD